MYTSNIQSTGLVKRIYEARCLLDRATVDVKIDEADLQYSSDEQVDSQERLLVNELAELTRDCDVSSPLSEVLSRDGRFELREGEDGWRLLLDLEPPIAGGRHVQAAEILKAIRDRGVTLGADLKAIREAESKHRENEVIQGLQVMSGRPAVAGEPGYIEVFCHQGPNGEVQRFEGLDGVPTATGERVCYAGEVIARVIAPTPGRDGFNARGEILTAPALPAVEIEAGENVRREGDELIAAVDGTVDVQGNRISVRRMLVVPHDLIGTPQSIDFDGDVQIDASVRGQVTVIATGDITIAGSVGVATIHSTGGSVYLKQGVAGQDRAIITAAVDIVTRFVEHAILRAGQDIHIEVGAIHALMTATRRIQAVMGRGQILGGVTVAGQCITAKQLGNSQSVMTSLLAGFTPDEIRQRSEYEVERVTLQRQYEEVRDSANEIKRMVGDVKKMSKDNKVVFSKLLELQLMLHRRLKALNATLAKREASDKECVAGEICATRMLHAGCKLTIGSASLAIREPQRAKQAKLSNGQITLRQV